MPEGRMIGRVRYFNPHQKVLVLKSPTQSKTSFQFEVENLPTALANYYVSNLKEDRLVIVRFQVEQSEKFKNTKMIITNISFPNGETNLSF